MVSALQPTGPPGRGDGRRFLITAGVETYQDSGITDLPGAVRDAKRVRELLEPMGYTHVLPSLVRNPTRAMLAEDIENWAEQTLLGPQDIVVVYFAGHGIRGQDRHYLQCTDSQAGRRARALPAEDLARPLVMSGVGHLLVMLDTCYAGAGTQDINRMAGDLAHLHRERANRWHLAAARAKDRAKDHAFVDALTDAFTNLRHGATQQFMSVREVTDRVNAYFAEHRPLQQARLTTSETDGKDPFFPSRIFIPGLPEDGIDLAALARLRRRHAGFFGPRSRGVEHAGEHGDYFTGRTRALDELEAFLTTPAAEHDRKARVVSGKPGSGKSALLGRLLTRCGPAHPQPAAAPPPAAPHRASSANGGSQLRPISLPVIVLHARRAPLEDLTADLAAALGLPADAGRDDILTVLGARTDPVAVVVDSLDEAGTAGDARESLRVARELLQPLSVLPSVRLVIGTRHPQIRALGHAVHLIDLDEPAYLTTGDISAYAQALLEDAQDPHSRSPYRDRHDLAATVAEGIARRAGSSFLVARMTARALVHGQIHIDTGQPGWREHLPSDAGEAFDAYLDRFDTHRPKVERLLRPLAYAQGAGLPWSTLWAPLAEALSGVPCSNDDLDWLHTHAGAYITETASPDGSAYRLFHETMAEHLRRPGREADDHALIARTLARMVPTDPATNLTDWPAAHPYIPRHLATHAAAGDILNDFVRDAEYLIHAHPAHLLNAFALHTPAMQTADARLAAAIYRASANIHSTLTPNQRRDILAIDAARYQQPHLAARLSRSRPWTPRWATGTLVNPAHHATLTGHTAPVRAVVVAQVDGRPHAVTASSDSTVRVWDLEAGTEGPILTGRTASVRAVVAVQIDGRPHAVTASADRTVRVWDLVDGRRQAVTASADCTVWVWDLEAGTERATLTGHTDLVTAVAVAQIDGRPHAVTASEDRTVRVWDLEAGTEHATLTGHTDSVTAVAVAQIDGRPHAVTTSEDRTVRVWDLKAGTEHATLTGHTDSVTAVAVAQIDGRPHAVTTSDDSTARVWDLGVEAEGAILTGHTDSVTAVAVAQIDGRPHAVTTSEDRTVRVWDLEAGTEHATLTGHTDSVTAVAVAQIDGRPHAVTTSEDRTVRVWDLKAGTEHATLTGHTDSVTAVVAAQIDGRPHAVTTSDDSTARVWDLGVEAEGAILTGHTDSVTAVAVAQIDGRPHAVTTGEDRTVRVWDLEAGTEHATLTGHTDSVTAVAVAQIDGRPHAVTASEDRTVRVWDLEAGTEHATLTGHTDSVTAVVAAQIDGRPHAVTAGDDCTVRVWDLEAGTERATLTGHTGWVTAVAVAQIDGRPHAVTASEDDTVRVWDLEAGTEHAILTGHTGWVTAVAVAQIDGRPHAVTASLDCTVRVWDLEAGTERATLTGHTYSVNAVAVAQIDGRPHAVTTSDDSTARVWDLEAGTEHATLTGHTDSVTAVVAAQIDGRPHAVTASDDRTVRVWDLVSARPIAVTYTPLLLYALVVHGSATILGMTSEIVVLERMQE
ncbi:caspase family protein [Streptomyces sp. NBC_00554]|uniref:caspase family protein n=1 Tax=Streptomyces sp. NBC_00554 TaxID=2903661 RepID=UPI00352BE9FC|nr:caspase family protein [Streptomyces sp. NBC_00554]